MCIRDRYQRRVHGLEAVETVQRALETRCGGKCRVYRAILMDLDMPVMNGIEATKRIKEMLRSSANTGVRIPIIACTANVNQEENSKFFEEYLMKPVLRDRLSYVLRYSQRRSP
eukprot:TRINITY_DN6815_c0_g1_i1.p3 TRINITY_DN6815_c0_g1~~TRINITY_DN6815_c0_g1_i1.p3  ORF type:complete len:114 (-),score=28.57 TRINITY_DN6815_c0_g1_i1:92-433(-)